MDKEEGSFILFREFLSFLQELPENYLFLSSPVPGPGEVEPDLEVTKFLSAEMANEIIEAVLRDLQPSFL